MKKLNFFNCNEKGFFTLIGICFLLVASILVIGLQETSRNYIIVADNFKNESDLKNIANSALIEAVEIIKSPDFEFKKPDDSIRHNNQYPIPLNTSYDADVTVLYEYGTDYFYKKPNITFMKRQYEGKDKRNDVPTGKPNEEGVVLISVASREIEGTTIYRRSMAYVLTEEDYKTIYFMNSLKDD